jgi:hypothetical protein
LAHRPEVPDHDASVTIQHESLPGVNWFGCGSVAVATAVAGVPAVPPPSPHLLRKIGNKGFKLLSIVFNVDLCASESYLA